uniref:VPS37 C-terminal domain-containing protein n=1 Tax=Timema tahoe TaxID=61484 RepID=A0A7R9IS08_9NEOP|nr:unnamed protein product [Timema tahoe]
MLPILGAKRARTPDRRVRVLGGATFVPKAIAEKFLDGDMELDSFLDQFITSRKVMHLRRVKADKMTEMVTARMRAPVVHPNSMSHSGQSFFPAPYPIGGHNMPMPPHYGVNMY